MISQKQTGRLRTGGVMPLLMLAAMTAVTQAAPPAWWSAGTPPVLNANAANNGGPATIGQAKWIAKNALAAVQAQDATLAALIEADLVGTGKPLASWAAPVTQEEKDAQKAPLLVGQLKAIAAPFYNQLNTRVPGWLAAERAANLTETNDGIFPWTQWGADDTNGAIATVGALKASFALHFTDDADADGMPDFKEWLKFGNADGNDYDGDGVSNLDEIANGTNPADPTVATTGGLPNDWLSFNANKVAVWPPLAQKTLAVNATATQAYTVRNDTSAAVTYTAVLSSNTVDTYSDTGIITMSDWSSIKGVSGTVTLPYLDTEDEDSEPVYFDNPGMTSFPFFGTNYTKVNVSSNGLLDFGTIGINSGANLDIPSTTTSVPIIAALWDDLDPGRGAATLGKVYCKKEANRVIIEYDAVMTANVSYSYSYTFQVHLYADGRIQVRYRDMPATAAGLSGATIGIQNGGGTRYRKVLYNGLPTAGAPTDNKMVEFSPVTQFFTLSPLTGTVAAHSTAALTGTFKAVSPQAPATFDAGVHVANANFSFTGGNPAATAQAVLTVTVPASTVGVVSARNSSVLPGGSATLSVTARDTLGVRSVEFYDGLTSLGVVPGIAGTAVNTYTKVFSPISRGQHSLRVKVTNGKGGVTWSGVTLLSAVDDDNDGVNDDWERLYFGTAGRDFSGPEGLKDLDNDGLADKDEFTQGSRPNVADTDHDGLLDGYEVSHGKDPVVSDFYDTDYDGIPDQVENATFGLSATNPADAWADSDGDGVPNVIEFILGRNMLVAEAALSTATKNADPDLDGLTTQQEIDNHLNPLLPDTDNDNLEDKWELTYASLGFDPHVSNRDNANAALRPDGDLDNDGLTNQQESLIGTNPNSADSDGDGVSDLVEYNQGSDPLLASDSVPPVEGLTPFDVNFGDPSGSHSERYKLLIKPVDHPGSPQAALSLEYGEPRTVRFQLRKGWKYSLQLGHDGSDPLELLNNGGPDFDYVIEFPGLDPADPNPDPTVAPVLLDANSITGYHDDSAHVFAAQGKTAYIYVAQLKSLARATLPADRARTKLGVGEVADLSIASADTTFPTPVWALGGTAGTSALTAGTTANNRVLTASDQASQPVVTVTVPWKVGTTTTDSKTLTLPYTVVEPTGTVYAKAASTGIFHTQGVPSNGWKGQASLLPADVSFQNIQIQEQSATGAGSGYYAYKNGAVRAAGAWTTVVAGDATNPSKVNSVETLTSGSDGAASPAVGSLTWSIPWQYKVGTLTGKQFAVVPQTVASDAAGRVTVTKGGHTESSALSDPTSSY